MNKIEKYSSEIPTELKMILEDAPRDDIDWALIIYLFRHSTVHYRNIIFEEKNIITVGKVAAWFDLNYDDVYKRLRRMIWWVSVSTVYGYRKPFSICSITQIAVDSIMKMIEIFEIKK